MSATRAARRRAEKEAVKTGDAPPTQTIKLENPVAQHFEAFIVANALQWEALVHDKLIAANREAAESLEPYAGIMEMREHGFQNMEVNKRFRRFRKLIEQHVDDLLVVKKDSKKGKHLVLCGAGPTLNDTAPEWVPQGDEVWAANSALPHLLKQGYKVTHGITVDQTAEMCGEWYDAPDVEYLLATTVHPHLTEFLIAQGRRVRFYNNFVGIKKAPVQWHDGKKLGMMTFEDWLYALLFPETVRPGGGLNTITRAIEVGMYAGFDKVTVLGADCALQVKQEPAELYPAGSPEHLAWLRESTVMHADGGHALASNATATTIKGEVDGRMWHTKPDLAISAQAIVLMRRHYKARLNVVGDTLPNALMDKDEEFFARIMEMIDPMGRRVRPFTPGTV